MLRKLFLILAVLGLMPLVVQARINLSKQVITQTQVDKIGKKLALSNFSGAKLVKINFIDCDLNRSNFKQANLVECTFKNCKLDEADFTNASLEQVSFFGILDGLSAVKAKFDGATIDNCNGLVDLLDNNQNLATGISFRNAKFNDSDARPNNKSFANIKLLDAYDFTNVTFGGSRMCFSRCEMGPNVIMANTQFNGVPWSRKLETIDVAPAGAYDNTQEGLLFFESIITGTNFANAKFSNVNFSYLKAVDINLRKAEFNNCKLLTSALSGDLSCTKFNNCIAKVNDFTYAKLSGSDLINWIERDADGSNGTNIFTPGLTYDHPNGLDKFECASN